jgi:hypothetical protein
MGHVKDDLSTLPVAWHAGRYCRLVQGLRCLSKCQGEAASSLRPTNTHSSTKIQPCACGPGGTSPSIFRGFHLPLNDGRPDYTLAGSGAFQEYLCGLLHGGFPVNLGGTFWHARDPDVGQRNPVCVGLIALV